MADGAADAGAEQAVMADVMAGYPADDGAAKTPGRLCRLRGGETRNGADAEGGNNRDGFQLYLLVWVVPASANAGEARKFVNR